MAAWNAVFLNLIAIDVFLIFLLHVLFVMNCTTDAADTVQLSSEQFPFVELIHKEVL